ncbi:MAG TPA: hypothetical protein V6D23_23790 [Candidatus Obscuribacterales bacterium]
MQQPGRQLADDIGQQYNEYRTCAGGRIEPVEAAGGQQGQDRQGCTGQAQITASLPQQAAEQAGHAQPQQKLAPAAQAFRPGRWALSQAKGSFQPTLDPVQHPGVLPFDMVVGGRRNRDSPERTRRMQGVIQPGEPFHRAFAMHTHRQGEPDMAVFGRSLTDGTRAHRMPEQGDPVRINAGLGAQKGQGRKHVLAVDFRGIGRSIGFAVAAQIKVQHRHPGPGQHARGQLRLIAAGHHPMHQNHPRQPRAVGRRPRQPRAVDFCPRQPELAAQGRGALAPLQLLTLVGQRSRQQQAAPAETDQQHPGQQSPGKVRGLIGPGVWRLPASHAILLQIHDHSMQQIC